MASAQDKRNYFTISNMRNRKSNRNSLPRGYSVESDESEILMPAHWDAVYPQNPVAARQAERAYNTERWKRYPGKVYDKRERPILIESLKDHHQRIERKRRDEFNAKWRLFLEREGHRLLRPVEKPIAKESFRLCQQCNNITIIAVDDEICSECTYNNLRNRPFVIPQRQSSRIPLPEAAAQKRRRYRQLLRNRERPTEIPSPQTAAHKRRQYKTFYDRVNPPVRTLPSTPLVITERHPYSFDMANFPQDLESLPLGLPEQSVNYHDQDWRYAITTMEDRDNIADYFLSKSDMPVYNVADFNKGFL